MNLTNKITQRSKLDSRRFAKGVACRIISDLLLISFIRAKGLIPATIIPGANGYDIITSRLLAIPLNKWSNLQDLVAAASINVDINNNSIPRPENFSAGEEAYTKRLSDLVAIKAKQDFLINFLRQNLILVFLPPSKLPAGAAIPDPDVYDIIIDSIDLSQSVDAELILRVKENVRGSKKWSNQ